MTTWGRTLTPNDDSTIPGTVVCVEVGTYSEVDQINPQRRLHRLRCGFAISGRLEDGKWTREKSTSFVASSQLWEWLNCRRQTGKPVWLFSARLSDLLTLTGFWHLMDNGIFNLSKSPTADLSKIRSDALRRRLSRPVPGLLVEADPPTCLVTFHQTGWKLIALDLRNYSDKPLTELSNLCNVENPVEPARLALNVEYETYVERAARVTQKTVERIALWHRANQMGHFGMTVSGMALAAFRHKWMSHRVELPPSQDDRDFERAAYYGGRTEPLWVGEMAYGRYHAPEGVSVDTSLYSTPPRGPFHLIDARSFYGAVMAFQSVPISCTGEGDGWPRDGLVLLDLDAEYSAHVHLVTDRHEFPCRMPDRTVYAVGDFWTHLCGPELERAARAGCVKDVGHWRRYNVETALREYALALWEQRTIAEANGDRLLASICKSLLARLHGKFGQRNHRWQSCPDVEAPKPWHRWHVNDAETGIVTHYRSIGWSVQSQTDGGDAAHCFPALAAWVTAWGREYLRTWCKIAGDRQVLYLSTDSLIVTEEGRRNLERAGIVGDHGLGSCRVVTTAENVRVDGTNHFRIGERVCFAGLPAGSIASDGRSARYATRSTLRQRLAHPPVESVAETFQVARLPPREETRRITPGGWLSKIVLSQEASRWNQMHPEIPTLNACE